MAFQFRMSSLRNEEDTLALLVWLFELPPSAITVDNWVVTVPPTIEAFHVYDACAAMGTYIYWSEHLFGDRYGITLRKETYPISVKGYDVMYKMGNHPMEERGWDFKKGKQSIPKSSGKLTTCGDLDYRRYHRKNLPIKFTTTSTEYDPADIVWLTNFNKPYY